jgi:hypothetical protein
MMSDIRARSANPMKNSRAFFQTKMVHHTSGVLDTLESTALTFFETNVLCVILSMHEQRFIRIKMECPVNCVQLMPKNAGHITFLNLASCVIQTTLNGRVIQIKTAYLANCARYMPKNVDHTQC